ncbi:uridine kinase family protein [Vallitalea okinawensis]|uniref:uridine kinase family protein n=1 Tax=Vallitalea okinawensis TaxID=2078660 RepID=UPI000CFC7730|nr:hypothetical protein [Vallitalea okinawensis]
MSYTYRVLKKNLIRYPEMEVQDALKLIYQSEFGCGHLIENKEASYKLLMKEWENVEENEDEIFESIGGGYARFNIGAAKKSGISPEIFGEVFLKSAEVVSGTLDNFYERVNESRRICSEGKLPFSVREIDSFLEQWEKRGLPLLRHSEKYRVLYKPAYRVVSEKYMRILAAIIRIHSKLKMNEKVVVGIDGPCGSGKTTLAQVLSEFFDGVVIQMDDFFLPPSLRSKERLSQPGGNIHYERFYQEVALKVIKNVDSFKYRVFSCKIMNYKNEIAVNTNKVLIVEGSYSLHPLYDSIYDVKLFCNVESDNQKERIIRRDGLEMYKNFEKKWIPMEDKYFNEFRIKEKCHHEYLLELFR